MKELPHIAPDGYYYRKESFNKMYDIVWLVSEQQFVYNGGEMSKTVWGFIHKKTGSIHAPINSKKVGKVVTQTRPYTAMPLNLNPLESVLYV